MRTSANPVLFAAACVAFVMSGALAGDEKADAKQKADDAAWLPPITTYRVNWRDSPRKSMPSPPSAFPDLVVTPSEWDKKEDTEVFWKRRLASFEKLCPRLLGITALKIEPNDDPLSKLLKVRLQQTVFEHQEHLKPIEGKRWSDAGRAGVYLLEMQDTLAELWSEQPKELVSWLGELIVAAKELERYTRLRVEVKALEPQEMAFATRVRLQLELALWRATRPSAEPIKKRLVGKDEKVPPAEDNWLTSKKVPPSLFPDLVPPPFEKEDRDRHWLTLVVIQRAMRYAALCPRLFGTITLKIEPADDTVRKLMKARLHQGTLQFQLTQQEQIGFGFDPSSFVFDTNGLLDMLVAATELWAEQPKELVPWLEELLIAAKERERYTRLRVEAGAYRRQWLNHTTQVRLKIEAELWKAKNAK